MTIRRYSIAFISIFLLIFYNLFSQKSDTAKAPIKIGIYGGANINLHSPDIDYTVPSTIKINNPLIFNENKNSFGVNAGIFADFPINEMFVISPRLGYNGMSVDFENDYNLLGFDTDTSTTMTLDASLNYLEITPAVKIYELIPVDKLYLLGGIELGVPLSANYSLDAELNDPDIQSFPGGGTTKNYENETDLPDASFRAALALGAGYDFKIADRFTLSPEASLRIPLTSVSSNDAFSGWSAPQFRAGVQVAYSLSENKEPEPELPPAGVNAGFKEILGYGKDGNSTELKTIKLEELQYTELFPLLPYVFFDENSGIPAKNTQELYAQNQAGGFMINKLKADPIEINSATLDITGIRMQENPNLMINIIGTTDSKGESGNSALAKQRADFAKNYIVQNYDIAPDRIKTRTADEPEKPSSSRVPEGVAENRRVEIYPINSNSNLLDPILISSDRQRIAEPELVEFIPFAETDGEIEGWEMEITQAGESIRKFGGEAIPPRIQWSILPNELKASELPVDYSFTVFTKEGESDTETGTVPVEYFSTSRKKSRGNARQNDF
jgi:hypothetical protein